MPSPVFAFLHLAEHPYAGEMLRRLLERGHAPALVLAEDSPLADTEREKFLERIAGHPVPPGVRGQAARHGLPMRTVARHTSDTVLDALAQAGLEELDLVVLGGTRILRGPVLDLPTDGVVNSHPGLLPECRGSASPAWSVLHDIPIGATTHLCDAGIDTGDLLLRRELPVRRGATYEDLCHGTLVLAGELMAEALDAWRAGRWEEIRTPQGTSPWPTFRNAPPGVLAVVRRRLAEGAYAHYAD